MEYIKDYINNSIKIREAALKDQTLLQNIEKAANLITETYKQHGKVMFAGNGGSAADAQHIACELVVKFQKERNGLPAFALTVDPSITTATSNDFGFELLFSKQIEAYANKNDVFCGISTSGNSINIINALKTAKEKGVKTICLLGSDFCKAEQFCDIAIKVPSKITSEIQEMHIMIGHIICAIVEQKLF